MQFFAGTPKVCAPPFTKCWKFPVSGDGVKVPLDLVPESSVAELYPAVNSSAVSAKSVSALKAATFEPIARPKAVLASLALLDPVPPSATVMSVIPVTEPPVIDTAPLACVASVPKPKLVLAPAASVALVPPLAKGSVPVTLLVKSTFPETSPMAIIE